MNGFLGSTILETAIGLVLVYLLLATFCTAANEWIAELLGARAETLHATLRDLLDNQKLPGGEVLLSAFKSHPVVAAHLDRAEHSPYIPPRAFSTAILDLATGTVHGSLCFDDFEKGLAALPDGPVKTALNALVQDSTGDLTRAQANIEAWFNDAMRRASAWYQKRTRKWTLLAAATVTVASNADTLRIVHLLRVEPLLRTAANMCPGPGCDPGLLLGWTGPWLDWSPSGWLSRLLGWVLTTVAVSLGAPFWFHTLNKLLGLRPGANSPQITAAGLQDRRR